MKNLSVKKLAGIAAGAVAVLAVIAAVAIFALRVDSSEAQQIALDAAGGGEIISRETSSEGAVERVQLRDRQRRHLV